MLYVQVFHPGDGDFEHCRGTTNGVLGFRDDATKIAVEGEVAEGGARCRKFWIVPLCLRQVGKGLRCR